MPRIVSCFHRRSHFQAFCLAYAAFSDSAWPVFPTWAEYIALTDPNDIESRFSATISFDADGTPSIGWNTPTSASRIYKVFGKVELTDSVWLEVNGNADLYRFFPVTVEIK